MNTVDDTHPEVRRRQFEIFRRMSAEEKVKLIDEMRRIERMLARTGLESRYPHLSAEEIEYRLHEMFLGKDLAARVYGNRRGDSRR